MAREYDWEMRQLNEEDEFEWIELKTHQICEGEWIKLNVKLTKHFGDLIRQ